MTAELGRQPWLVYGIMRTNEGFSPMVSAGNGLFTLIGFMGMYMVLGIMYLFMVWHEIEKGREFLPPESETAAAGILPEIGRA